VRGMIRFTLDGREVEAREGESILQAAARHGVDIPHLCYKDGLRADGNCRACVVEIAGERTLAPSCCRAPKDGMQVRAQSARAVAAQKMVLELLAVGHAGRSGARGFRAGCLGKEDEPRRAALPAPRAA
jgi:formate dehydrogenase major subunit